MERFYILINVFTVHRDGSREEYKPGTLFKGFDYLDRDTIKCSLQPEEEGQIIIILAIPKSFLELLQLNEFELLLAIPLPEENRMKVWKNKQWLNEGLNLYVGCPIVVCNHSQLPNGTEGVVRYSGPLPSKHGIWFGVELAPQYAGDGTTDGMFRRARFFHCADDCGIFVSIYRLRNNEHVPLMQSRGYQISSAEADVEENIFKSFPFKLEDRVVWLSDEGPEAGIIKWIGRLPDSNEDSVIVGVHFDNPVGSGTGRYKGEQLFLTPRGHASLMPPLGLIKYADFYGESENSLSDRLESLSTRDTNIKSMHMTQADYYSGPDSYKYDGAELQGTSLETSPPSLTRNQDPDIITSTGVRLGGSIDPVRPRDAFQSRAVSLTSRDTLPSRDTGISSMHVPRTMADSNLQAMSYKLDIHHKVYTVLKNKRYGVIRYIGPHPNAPERKIAGIQMEIPDPTCYTDGVFAGKKMFDCPPKTAFFVYLDKCYPDDRGQDFF